MDARPGKVADRNFKLSVQPALCGTAPGALATKKVFVSDWLRWQAGQELPAVLDHASLEQIAEPNDMAPRLPPCG